MTWDEVDLDRAEVTLPPARVKIDQPFWMPLSAPAVRILRDLPERRGPRLFPVISWARCKRGVGRGVGRRRLDAARFAAELQLAGTRPPARRFRRRRARPGTHAGGGEGALRLQRSASSSGASWPRYGRGWCWSTPASRSTVRGPCASWRAGDEVAPRLPNLRWQLPDQAPRRAPLFSEMPAAGRQGGPG